jgi:predicted site-specific integrase-resolvase
MDFAQNGFVAEAEAAKFLGVAVQSMRNWRHQGRGPAYIKKGRMVRYAMQDLMDYMAADRIDPERRRVAMG